MTIIKEECTNELRWHKPSYTYTDDILGTLRKGWHSPRLQQKWLIHKATGLTFEQSSNPMEYPYYDDKGRLMAAITREEWRDVPVVEE